MTKEETKLYSRGYAAGRKKKEKDLKELESEIRRQIITEFERNKIYDRYFCAALTGLIAHDSTWTIGEKKVNNSEMHVRLAKIFADEAIKQNRRY